MRHGTTRHNIQPFTVMAEEHPPSPKREDESLSFGRLRVKPAMTAKGEVRVPHKKANKSTIQKHQ